MNKLIKKLLIASVVIIFSAILCITVFYTVLLGESEKADPGWDTSGIENYTYEPLIINKYSRPGTVLEEINGIVIHYVANPGSSANANRKYFEGLALSGATYASSHFLVGLEGEIIQCIPLSEIAYCSNSRNSDTIAVEVCHPDETGKFNEVTVKSVVDLCAELCRQYSLNPEEDLIRHYDITGKLCPLYFVEHEDEWNLFKAKVSEKLAQQLTSAST